MEPKIDVLASIEAKSRQTSIDDLAKRGKKRVRVIRAKDIALMVEEAIERAVASSDWVPPEQVEELKREAAEEFASVKKESAEEAKLARERDEEIARLREEIEALQLGELETTEKLESAQQSVDTAAEFERELAEARSLAEERHAEIEALRQAMGEQGAELTAVRRRHEELCGELGTAQSQVSELENLIATEAVSPGGEAPADAAPASAMEEDLAAIVGSLDDRLDKLGRKMGVTSAVESDIDYSTLVNSTMAEDEPDLESNMDAVDIEKREGAGIEANLARMKKLRGD